MAFDHVNRGAHDVLIKVLETKKAALTAQLLSIEQAQREAREKAAKEAREKVEKEAREIVAREASEKVQREMLEKGAREGGEKIAEKGAGFVAKKGVGFFVRKIPLVFVGTFAWDWWNRGFQGAVDEATWPLSEAWKRD